MADEQVDCVPSKQVSSRIKGQLGGTMLTLDINYGAAQCEDQGANLNSNFAAEKDVELGSGSGEFLRGVPFVDPYALRELSHSKVIGVRGPSFCTPIEAPINGSGGEYIKLMESTRVAPGGAGLSKTKCYAWVHRPRG